jgi:23S rRNA pseudouridine1911/1915/1917 synthase
LSDRIVEFCFSEKEETRLDKFLVDCLPEFSRSRLQALIRDEKVAINGKIVVKSGASLLPGHVIQVTIPAQQPSGLIPEAIHLDVVFENEDLVLVNKPAGMVVHPSVGHTSGTLVHAALAYMPEIEGVGGEIRPGVVHRLDKDTSGLILLAKNDHAHQWLQNQFRQRKVKKVYLALVDGKPPTPTGRVEAAIGRDSSHRKRMAVVTGEKGREATSEYFTLESFPHHTLLEVHPLTGRTHQIRLHLAFVGCPIVGDIIYGHRHPTISLNRHFLHAARLTITLPGEKVEKTFEAPLPQELQAVLEYLRGEIPLESDSIK